MMTPDQHYEKANQLMEKRREWKASLPGPVTSEELAIDANLLAEMQFYATMATVQP